MRSGFTTLKAVLAILLCLLSLAAWGRPSSVAFYYGAEAPWDELQAFDWVVLDPGHYPVPPKNTVGKAQPFAYVSVGEVAPDRPYAKEVPKDWLLGGNPAWGSAVVDLARPEWTAFLADKVVRPLWESGYRNFFLDTLDSYQLYATTPEARSRQEAGLVSLIRGLRARFPGIGLFLNRGFEVLPQVHDEVAGVAVESLFEGWDAETKQYRPVPEADRAWLLDQLKRVKNEYHLPVVAIDYVSPERRGDARKTADKIRALGFIPWVANPGLDMLGVGAVEVMPRKVLVIYPGGDEYQLTFAEPLRFAAVPLNYLGYVPVYRDATEAPPDYPINSRYAGIVVWLPRGGENVNPALGPWLAAQAKQGVRLAVFDDFGFALNGAPGKALGFAQDAVSGKPGKVKVASALPPMGFEAKVRPDREGFFPLRLEGGKVLLRIAAENGQTMDAAGFTPWGGYVLYPYAVESLPIDDGSRWLINPVEFLRQALALPPMPVPDTTTENGRRLLMVHIDGDGFASRAELPGAPFSGEVLLKDVLEKYPLPTTFSVIQGEVAADGLYPKDSPQLEAIARRLFALPNVEAASHSFSHPFNWRKAEGETQGGEGDYHLAIKGYEFNLATEIKGSVDYINRHLLPDGKRVKVFLWTGNCNPGKDALEMVEQLGLANMNGGETTISRRSPSLTLTGPIGIPKGGYFQVYAPNQNENVYTGLWTGPYYGYRTVVETFDMTDHPYRLKPIDIYYHVYSATKRASLKALDEAYRYALSRPTLPLYVSEYTAKAEDFNRALVVREPGGWRVASGGALREWRVPLSLGVPDLAASTAMAGYSSYNGERYVHLAGAEGALRFAAAPPPRPYLIDANGRLEGWRQEGRQVKFSLRGYVPLEFSLGNAAGCRVRTDGEPLQAAGNRYRLKHGTAATFEIDC